MKEVTDPSILGKLNMTEVTDPSILSKLQGVPEVPAQKQMGFGEEVARGTGDVALGTVETAAGIVTGGIASLIGLAGSVGAKAIGQSDPEARAFQDYLSDIYTYKPYSYSGKGAMKRVGQILSPVSEGLDYVQEVGGVNARNVMESALIALAPKGPKAVRGTLKGVKTGFERAKGIRDIRQQFKELDTLHKELNVNINNRLNKSIRPTAAGKRTYAKMSNYDGFANEAVLDILKNKKLNVFERKGQIVKGENPKTLGEMSKVLDDNMTRAVRQRSQIAQAAGETAPPVNGVKVGSVLDEIINNPRQPLNAISDAQFVKDWVQGKREVVGPDGKLKTIYKNEAMISIEAQELLSNLNAQAKKWYRSPDMHSRAFMAEKAAQQLRMDLAESLGQGGVEYQALGRQIRNYMTIEKDLMNRWQVDKRKNTYGFFDLANLAAVAEVARGLTSKSAGGMVPAASLIAAKQYMKWSNSPNTQVMKMFGEAERTVNIMNKKIGKQPSVPDVIPSTPGQIEYTPRLETPDVSGRQTTGRNVPPLVQPTTKAIIHDPNITIGGMQDVSGPYKPKYTILEVTEGQ